jgi:hypothetical protein
LLAALLLAGSAAAEMAPFAFDQLLDDKDDPDTLDLPPAVPWGGDALAPIIECDAPDDQSLTWAIPCQAGRFL